MRSNLHSKIVRLLAILLLVLSLDFSSAVGQTKKNKSKNPPSSTPAAVNVQIDEKQRTWWGFPWIVAGVLTVLPVVVCLKKLKPAPTEE